MVKRQKDLRNEKMQDIHAMKRIVRVLSPVGCH